MKAIKAVVLHTPSFSAPECEFPFYKSDARRSLLMLCAAREEAETIKVIAKRSSSGYKGVFLEPIEPINNFWRVEIFPIILLFFSRR